MNMHCKTRNKGIQQFFCYIFFLEIKRTQILVCKLVWILRQCFSCANYRIFFRAVILNRNCLSMKVQLIKWLGWSSIRCGRAFSIRLQARGGVNKSLQKGHFMDLTGWPLCPPPRKTCFFFFVDVAVVHDRSLQSCIVAWYSLILSFLNLHVWAIFCLILCFCAGYEKASTLELEHS